MQTMSNSESPGGASSGVFDEGAHVVANATRGQAAPARSRTPRRSGGLGWRSPHAIVGILCIPAIGFGWLSRRELDLSPSDGLGYAFGIAGLSMMVALLGYSIRKRSRTLRRAGPLRSWFEGHLILGLLGPTLILYHSNFGSGSTNATISLACVLAVSGSGVGGRFLYGGMHRSMAGERRSVKGFLQKSRGALVPIESVLERVPIAGELIGNFERTAVGHTPSLLRALPALWLRPRAWRTKRRVLRFMRDAGIESQSLVAAQQGVQGALGELCRAGELRLFERLFALWHAIHIPLTIILFISAAIHVVAVHLC